MRTTSGRFAIRYLVVAACLLCACGQDEEVVCFPAGTRVATPSGDVPIQTLRAGDTIVSVDPGTGESSVARILANRKALASSLLVIRTEDGQAIRATSHHPVWVPQVGSFVEVGNLREGYSLAAWDGERVVASPIAGIVREAGRTPVYHLEVDGAPKTFVADGFIVHNKPPPPVEHVVSVTVDPPNSGWILLGDELLGQGADTTATIVGTSAIEVEAVPRIGWRFERWEGSVSRTDTFVVHLIVEYDSWLRCVYKQN